MTKWQFCELTVEYGGPIVGITGELTWWPNGETQSRKDKAGKMMHQLGQEGWELVSTSIIQSSGVWNNRRVVHMFKRPLVE